MDGDSPTTLNEHSRLSMALSVGPVLLYLAATAYGILEVHSSTDTWIGLAAGRQILTADEFPKQDTFSYTFSGEVWYNQNWLTHLAQYWLYSRRSPNAVVYGTWAMSASVFALVLLAAYWRSGTWLGALLAASVVGLGCRDFLSARPATTGFFCIASLWALLCALEGQREKRRWWPIFLLLPLLVVWGNAHGSFVFGYGVLGLYVGHWLVVRTIRVRHFRPRVAVADRQVAALVGVVIAALILTAVLGPFGIENFTHGQKVAGSEVFRQVSEWRPPYARERHFPPVWRFWTVLGISLGMLSAGGLLFLVSRGKAPAEDRKPPRKARGGRRLLSDRAEARAASPGLRLHTSLFDVALVVIGLSMTLWARRFAPIYFIFGAPVFLVWIVRLLQPTWALARSVWPPLPQVLRTAAMASAGVFALYAANETYGKARHEIFERFEHFPQFNLLERVTRYDLTPHSAILFLKNNDLHVNLLVEWTQAGPVMFHARNAKVFMDGRAQQVYDEEHYRTYYALLVAGDTPRRRLMLTLDRHNTDAVLLRRTRHSQNLWTALVQSRQWVAVLLGKRFGLFLRKDSPALAELGELLRRGEEWRPNSPQALVSRGFVWEAIRPPDLEQAITCWKAAVRQSVTIGKLCFPRITTALLELGREPEARQFVTQWHRKLNRPVAGLPDRSRRELLKTLNRCWNDIEAATTPDPADEPDTIETATQPNRAGEPED